MRRTVLLGVGLALVLAAVAAAWLTLPIAAWIDAAARWIQGFGPWAPALYAGLYAVALVALVPGGPLSIGAGLVFGFWGVPVVLAGATAGAALAFLVSRHVMQTPVRRMMEGRPRLLAVDRAVAEEGWRIVALVRLSPLIPFNLQNYVFGVTRIGFWPFVLATALGIAPGAMLYVYLGIVGRSAGSAGPAKWTLLALGLLATVAVTVIVERRARAALAGV